MGSKGCIDQKSKEFRIDKDQFEGLVAWCFMFFWQKWCYFTVDPDFFIFLGKLD